MILTIALVFSIPFASIIDVADYDSLSLNQCIYRLVQEGLGLEYERTSNQEEMLAILRAKELIKVDELIQNAEVEGEASKYLKMVVLWKDDTEYKVSYMRQNLWYSIRIKRVIDLYGIKETL